MPLSDTSRRVWRAVAARGRTGIGSGQIHDHFKGQIDSVPLTTTLKSLRDGGYLQSNGRNKWSTWTATDRVPLGEDRPAWLDDVATEPDAELGKAESADAVVAAAKAAAAPWPFGKLGAIATPRDGVDIDAAHKPAGTPSRAQASPWFALDSDGCLSLRADNLDGKLSADSTRALFSWLDRLAYKNLSDTVEAES